MSVAVLITRRNETDSGANYLPLATEDTFAQYWLPAAAELGCVWVPLFRTGTPVPLEDLPAVLAELERLRDYFERTPGMSEDVRERSRWLVNALSRLDPTEIREVFIG